MKKLSVVIPCYERDAYLEKAIDSCLQSCPDIEVIILDNASKNNGIKMIATKYNNNQVSYIRNDSNIGLFGNWNKAFDVANSEYVYILGDDDYIDPDFIQEFYRIEKEYDIDIFFSDFKFIDENDIILNKPSFKAPKGYISKNQTIDYMSKNGFGVPTISMIYKKNLFSTSGFDTENFGSNDWEYFYLGMPWKNAFSSAEKLVYYRNHSQGASKAYSSICNISMHYIYEHSGSGPLSHYYYKRAVKSWHKIDNTHINNKYVKFMKESANLNFKNLSIYYYYKLKYIFR